MTIERDPWCARWSRPETLYSEYFERGALGNGVARLDSVLHLTECRYRWRPLQREILRGVDGTPLNPLSEEA